MLLRGAIEFSHTLAELLCSFLYCLRFADLFWINNANVMIIVEQNSWVVHWLLVVHLACWCLLPGLDQACTTRARNSMSSIMQENPLRSSNIAPSNTVHVGGCGRENSCIGSSNKNISTCDKTTTTTTTTIAATCQSTSIATDIQFIFKLHRLSALIDYHRFNPLLTEHFTLWNTQIRIRV